MNNFYFHDPKNSWINTASGKKFFPLAPSIDLFDIQDQAHALSHIARYNGQSNVFWSVAAHAMLVSEVCRMRACEHGDRIAALAALWGIVHDNAEAYIGDICYPLKQMPQFDFFRELDAKYDRLLCQWLNIDPDSIEFNTARAIVEDFDKEVCTYEAPNIFEIVHPDWYFKPEKATFDEKRVIESHLNHYSGSYASQAYLARFLEALAQWRSL
jgi:hypothetical protein